MKSGASEIYSAVVQHVIERDQLRRRAEQLEVEHVRFARMAAIGEVAAGIAHEIRNPMTVISGMASLIRDNFDQLPPDELRQCARTIADNCMHLNRVLDEVLSSSSGTGSRTPMLISELLDETLAFMRFDQSFRYRMEIERDFQQHGLVIANRDELKQVFINLFRNAAQAVEIAGKNKGVLRVSIQETGGEVITSVTDDGPGIAPEAFEHLFETGFTTKHEGSGETKGSGLGLGICRRILENHGGRLWADPPKPGEGATFCMALPRAESGEAGDRRQETEDQETDEYEWSISTSASSLTMKLSVSSPVEHRVACASWFVNCAVRLGVGGVVSISRGKRNH